MIKNIILDVGGVIFDDSKENVGKVLKRDASHIYKKVYGNGFRECLLGNMTIDKLIKSFEGDPEYKDIEFLLNKNNLKISYPIIQKNYEYIKSLKNRGYRLFLLTNITKESYFYIKEQINIDKLFDGGIYSYQENLKKPDPRIFELILNRFNLKKEETIFFDDREKNINAANDFGIKSILFKSTDDIENALKDNYFIGENV